MCVLLGPWIFPRTPSLAKLVCLWWTPIRRRVVSPCWASINECPTLVAIARRGHSLSSVSRLLASTLLALPLSSPRTKLCRKKYAGAISHSAPAFCSRCQAFRHFDSSSCTPICSTHNAHGGHLPFKMSSRKAGLLIEALVMLLSC